MPDDPGLPGSRPQAAQSQPARSETARAQPSRAGGAQNTPPLETAQASAKPKSRRGPLFALLGVVVLVAGLGWLVYDLLVLSHYVSTDDAYVGADVAQITPQVNGQVLEVRVQDTQAVKKGDELVVIDPADANLSVAQAQAQYGQAQRKVRQDLANDQAAAALITARDADLLRAKAQLAAATSDVDRTLIDLKRRQALSGSGAVSGEELTTAKNAYQTAVANLDAVKAAGAQAVANKTIAEGQLASSQALTQGADLETNPEVAAAKAMLNTALLNQSRTVIRAPFDGVVAQRQVQVGQRVAIGASLMTLVPVSRVYVDANFKEVQLRKIQLGQPAELTADRWGKGVVFHGRVQGLAGGTGSAFAVIPAQNATGNWIKVVQRLPVRIALDPRELQRRPLRVGLSMDVKVDVGQPGHGPPEQASQLQATQP